MVKTFRLEEFGFEVEIGKVANQASGAAWFKYGGTVVLASAAEAESKEFPGFFPLSVDYREQYSAAGKIPGGYYKREGKSSDREVLIGRLVDRALRPLFPDQFFNQVQVILTVYSVDKEHSPRVVALNAASLAVILSDIPFKEAVGAVEVARVEGNWIINPLHPESMKADARFVIAGTADGICMVEGSANEIPEQEFIDILFKAHDAIKKIVSWQESVRQEVGKQKHPIADPYKWAMWEERVESFLTDDRVQKVYSNDKIVRTAQMQELRGTFAVENEPAITELRVPGSVIDYIFDSVLKKRITDMVCASGKRIDGRNFDEIRNISLEVGVLPFAHGSALFTRGRTQALVSVTLGSGQDEQRFESIMDGDDDGSFLLHYNFLPFCTGEVKPMRGPGRREVGHGHLAAAGLKFVRPDKNSFPYTIRIVADILESDGSSSMATACGSVAALMQTGVPIKKMIGGIAMGMLQSKKSAQEFVVLSDILGLEDAFGLMDFKVIGTDTGITAVQMDIKHKGGLSRALFETALEQARKGRLHIMSEMRKVISEPNKKLSDLVPRVETIKIDTDKIGAVIGSGGKTIREITEKTSTSIDIDQDGMVKIFGIPGAAIDQAVKWVKTLTGQITRGEIYTGKIRKVADFGMFVELVPGQDGLVHVSNLPKAVQKTFGREYKVNDIVTVEVLDYDEVTGRISLRMKDETYQNNQAN